MTLFSLESFSVSFETPAGTAHAVRGVDLQVGEAEILGVVGESGSGKSAMLLGALGLAGPRARIAGRALYDGAVLSDMSDRDLSRVRGRQISMVFQDPASALNPVQPVGRQIREAIRLNRPQRANGSAPNADALAHELFREVGLGDPERQLRAYPHELSGGQSQRAMIAMMLAGNPSLLIADEPTTALDVTVQAQVLDMLKRISRDRGMSVVLVSHDLGVVAQVCDRIAVMYGGQIVECGPVMEVFDAPRHPYAKGLMAARPGATPVDRLAPIEGDVPSPLAVAAGCPFAPRCARSSARCRTAPPPTAGGAHWWRCFNPLPVGAA